LDISITIPQKETIDETTRKTIIEYTCNVYKHFLKKSEYSLFAQDNFRDIIYKNVEEAVKEVIELAGVSIVNKVILSGRSTAFPLIKEKTISKLESILNLKKIDNKNIIDFGLVGSKTAVAKGACWYGINNNAVRLHHKKTTASFGYRKTLDTNKTNVEFESLIYMGQNFNKTDNGISFCEEKRPIMADTFNFDGNKVNFYQIMGKDANTILSEDQKHKYSKIATIRIDQPATEIAMRVKENDEIDCLVRLLSNRVLSPDKKGAVADQEINDANAEHYTWIVT
jgi:hypothetical protein